MKKIVIIGVVLALLLSGCTYKEPTPPEQNNKPPVNDSVVPGDIPLPELPNTDSGNEEPPELPF